MADFPLDVGCDVIAGGRINADQSMVFTVICGSMWPREVLL